MQFQRTNWNNKEKMGGGEVSQQQIRLDNPTSQLLCHCPLLWLIRGTACSLLSQAESTFAHFSCGEFIPGQAQNLRRKPRQGGQTMLPDYVPACKQLRKVKEVNPWAAKITPS